MARPIYSASFIRISSAVGAATTVYTVPVGYVAVVRSMDMVNIQKLATCQGFVSSSGPPGLNTTFWNQGFPAIAATAADSRHWDGHVAIPAGGTLQFAVTGVAGGILALTAAGYLLLA